MIVLQQMLIFFVMIALGIVTRKLGMITPANQQNLSSLIVLVTSPCLILSSAMNAGARMPLTDILHTYASFAVVIFLALGAAWLVPKLIGFPARERSAANLMFWCTNIAFMGLPLIQGVYGKDAMIYVTLLLVPLNILFYSYAIWLISRDAREGDGFRWKSLLNPGMAACVLTCLIYFLEIPVPYVISQSVTMIGNITAPLAIMMIGASLLDVNRRSLFGDKRLYAFLLIKMLLCPLVILLLVKPFIDNIYVLAACLAFLATPTGGMVSMLAALYNKDAYLTTTREISLSTLVSVVTLPVVALVL